MINQGLNSPQVFGHLINRAVKVATMDILARIDASDYRCNVNRVDWDGNGRLAVNDAVLAKPNNFCITFSSCFFFQLYPLTFKHSNFIIVPCIQNVLKIFLEILQDFDFTFHGRLSYLACSMIKVSELLRKKSAHKQIGE